MTPAREPDAKGIGACLNDSALQNVLARAKHLAEIQTAIHEWAGEPLASSLTIANERGGILVIYADSAAALTQLRYKQQELIHFLQHRLGLAFTKLDVKTNPAARSG